jgi:hypothetical protein
LIRGTFSKSGQLSSVLSHKQRGSRERANALASNAMNPIAALDAKIERARQLVAEQRQRARSLHTRDDETSKSRQLIHDLTHWLHNLEGQRDNLLRESRFMAQRGREVV